MSSHREQHVGRALRRVVAQVPVGASIADTKGFDLFLSALEFYIPEVLLEHYGEWERESLDGLLPLHTAKSGDREADILGLCILGSDQTTTPIQLSLRVSTLSDKVEWLECKLGEADDHGDLRRESFRIDQIPKRLQALEGRAEKLDWIYRAAWGTR